MKKKALQNSDSYIVNGIIFILILSIYFLSIGYSAFSATPKIEGIMATVMPRASVQVTAFSPTSNSNGGISVSDNYNISNVYGNVSLPNASSTVTYKVNVTVFNAAEMKIVDITGLPSNLEYSLTDYTLGSPLCDSNNECNLGATTEFYITIGYKSGEYDGNTTSFPFNLELDFQRVQHVAKVGNTYFESLQDAIDTVPNTGVQTTVQLLMDYAENIEIDPGQNVNLVLNNNTLSNDGNFNVIVNNGTLTISGGTVSISVAQGAINNNSTATLYVTGATINGSGKQAIYNDGGTCYISSGKMTTTSSQRAAVHNIHGGTMEITGGTIIATNYSAVKNEGGTLTIGTQGGTPSKTTPVLRGKTYGVEAVQSFDYYDGLLQGKTLAINDETLLGSTESGFDLIHSTKRVEGADYHTVYLGEKIIITFDPEGGTVGEASREIEKGSAIGSLPTATQTGFTFLGWYTAQTGGTQITATTTFNSTTTIHAQWGDIYVAMIGNTSYSSLADAITAAPNNTQTTIKLTKNIITSTRFSTSSSKNIIFDFDGHTISNESGSFIPIFENNGGTITLKNGTIVTDAGQGAVNNKSNGGTITIEDMTINAIGTRQCVYNEHGNMIIKTSTLINESNERSAVHNLNNATLTILSGTIKSNNFSAIKIDGGTVTLGNDDGSINTSNPTVIGKEYGVLNSSTFNFYDGIIKGIDDSINGSYTLPSGASVQTGTETIGGNTYNTIIIQ